jgi:CubicO group peptidase (beta-lactamase class C family)
MLAMSAASRVCIAIAAAGYVSTVTMSGSQAPSRSEGPTRALFDPAVAAARELPRLYSLVVSWRGSLVVEHYQRGASAMRPANVKSVSKSVISALVGIAIDRGLLRSVHEPIGTYFPELLPAADGARRRITVEDLLTMRSGLETTSNRNYGAWVQSDNWVRHALMRPVLTAPGTHMDYSTGNTHLLSAILTKATGVSTWRFAQDALAQPLKFSLPQWTRDPQGIYFGGNEMLLAPRQMLAIGELYLHRGTVEGRQIVPASWIDASFVPRGRSERGDRDDREYGYGWWMRTLAGERTYYAWGYGGQFIFVVPSLDLVVVTTSSTAGGDERRSHRRTVNEVVEDLIIAPIAGARSIAQGG